MARKCSIGDWRCLGVTSCMQNLRRSNIIQMLSMLLLCRKNSISPKGQSSGLQMEASLIFRDQYFYSKSTNTKKQGIFLQTNSEEHFEIDQSSNNVKSVPIKCLYCFSITDGNKTNHQKSLKEIALLPSRTIPEFMRLM